MMNLNLVMLIACIAGCSCTYHIVGNQLVLQEHNSKRVVAGSPELAGDIQLSVAAKACVEKMLINNWSGASHPCNPQNSAQGENIYTWFSHVNVADAGMQADVFKRAMKAWYDEHKYIDFKQPDWFFTLRTDDVAKPVGHFTQVMWKATTKVGCAIGSSSMKTMVVCRYSPAGNQFTAASIRDNVPVIQQPTVACVDKSHCQWLECEGDFASMAKQDCPKKCKQC